MSCRSCDPEQHDRHGPRVALWGTFDVANYGDHLFPRVFQHELLRRLPTAQLRVFSPLGDRHPVALDRDAGAEPLGRWSFARAAELAAELDLVVVGGGEIVHTRDDLYDAWYREAAPELRLFPSEFFIDGLGRELERTCPVAWHAVGVPFDFEDEERARVRAAVDERAYVSVRDELSRERLVRAGVEREIRVVPDSALLLERIVARAVLDDRVDRLRSDGSYPVERPLVVQGNRSLLPHVESIARGVKAVLAEFENPPVVVLETGICHGDDAFADALAPQLPGARRIRGTAELEDIAAAIASARGYVGISLHGAITALLYRVPSAILDLAHQSKLVGFAQLVGRADVLVSEPAQLVGAIRNVLASEAAPPDLTPLTRLVDDHFDRLAELAQRSTFDRSHGGAKLAAREELVAGALREAESRYERLRVAHDALGRRFKEHADLVAALRYELEMAQAEVAAHRRELERAGAHITKLTQEVAESRAALAELLDTKLFRYGGRIRDAYARVRTLTRR